MFRLLVSHLMLCSLGAHTLLGCCWHHAHADACGETLANCEQQMTQQNRPHIHLGCGHHHHHNHQHAHKSSETETPLAPQHSPGSSCCLELPCSYVTSAPSRLPHPEWDQLDETPQLVALANARHQMFDRHASRWEAASAGGSAALEVRDATQVWLL